MKAIVITAEDIFPTIDRLIDAWCERRALAPLRHILGAYPLPPLALTDSWGQLYDALKDISITCKPTLPREEWEQVKELMRQVDAIIHRR